MDKTKFNMNDHTFVPSVIGSWCSKHKQPVKKCGAKFPKGIEVEGIVKLGGYYYWDWKFPFRHFKKEEVKVFTKNAIYDLN